MYLHIQTFINIGINYTEYIVYIVCYAGIMKRTDIILCLAHKFDGYWLISIRISIKHWEYQMQNIKLSNTLHKFK